MEISFYSNLLVHCLRTILPRNGRGDRTLTGVESSEDIFCSDFIFSVLIKLEAGPTMENGHFHENFKENANVSGNKESRNTCQVNIYWIALVCLRIIRMFRLGLSEIVWFRLGLSEIKWFRLGLSEIIRFRLGLSEIIWFRLGLSEIIWFRLGLSEIRWFRLGLFEIIWYRLGLSEIIWFRLGLSEII